MSGAAQQSGGKKREVVLAAEDDENDAFILRRSFKRAGLSDSLVIVQDGSTVVEYLSGEGAYADRDQHPWPSLLLLDLKMPRMNGFDVLEWLARRKDVKNLPAVVLSSSCHEKDIEKCRELGAAEYFIKPLTFDKWPELVETLAERWLRR